MPRKKVILKIEEENKIIPIDEKLNNTFLNYNSIIKLPLTEDNINNSNYEIIEENVLPIAYDPNLYSELNTFSNVKNKESICLWCRHSINDFMCGLPLSYNITTKHYNMFGIFCSFECSSAYNFSKNSKSDKVWVINDMINKLAISYGLNIPIRPAPDYECTNLFLGNMTIEEFRNAHKSTDKSYTLNIPPQSQVNTSVEVLNTSYINARTNKNNKISIEKMI
jgi:hypothetical protein